MISRKILLLCTCMSHGAIVREFKKNMVAKHFQELVDQLL